MNSPYAKSNIILGQIARTFASKIMETENGSPTSTASPTTNHDAEIIAIVAVFLAFSLVALVLRLMSRRLKHVKLYYDDYLAIGAWVRVLIEDILVITHC